MTKRPLFIGLLFYTLAAMPALAAEKASCDVFRKRFVEASRVLSLQLPNLRLNREPPDPILKDDTWATEGMRAKDTGELWYTTTLHCREGRFYDVFSDIDTPVAHLVHPTFDLIAASIYAYTGWEANKVIRVTDEIMKSRPLGMGQIKPTELLPGAYAKIAYSSFAIELD